MENPTIISAFIAGLLAFLSPCVLPLLPGYISFISGESIESLINSENKSPRMKAFLGAIFFGLGFTLVFVLLGASATKIGQLLQNYKILFGRVAGAVIILFGLHMAGIFRINRLLVQKKWNRTKGSAPFYVEAFLLGVAFVFGWTPCIGPILAGILALAANESTVSHGIGLLFVFGLGLWIPFLLSALMLGYAISLVRKAGKIVLIVEKLSGALLILIGVLMLTGNMTLIVSWLIRIFPVLGTLNF